MASTTAVSSSAMTTTNGGAPRRVSRAGAAGTSLDEVQLSVPTFACMIETRVSYVFATRTTHSDVMSVKVTSEPAHIVPPPRRAGPAAKTLRRLQLPPPRTMPVHPAFATSKKSKALIRERDAFMAKLRQEREERHIRENLAAVRIQAVYRGHLVRPKPRHATREPRTRRNSEADWREELRALTHATEEHLNGGVPPPEWRKSSKRTAKRNKKLQRAVEYTAAAAIQSVVRGFLARRAFRTVYFLHNRTVQHSAVTRIQSRFRGFALRRSLAAATVEQREQAAIMIQCLVRGVHARTRCRWLMRRMRDAMEQAGASVAIQCAFRSRVARDRVSQRRQHRAAVKVQSSLRGHAARRDVNQKVRQRREAAVRIQSVGRSYVARQEYGPAIAAGMARRKEEAAAVRIQSVARGRTAREQVADKRARRRAEMEEQRRQEEAAATHMQRVARGKMSRRRVDALREERVQEHAATRIQALKRGQAARAHVSAKRKVGACVHVSLACFWGVA